MRWLVPLSVVFACTLAVHAQTCDGVPSTTAHRSDPLSQLVSAVGSLWSAPPVAWRAEPSAVRDRQAELKRTRDYVAACVRERGDEWFWTPATLEHTVCCQELDDGSHEHDQSSGSYYLRVDDGRVVLRKVLLLLYQGDPDEEQRVREEIERTRAVLTEVFAAHGIELDLQLDFAGGFTSAVPLEWASTVFLHDVLTVYDEVPRGQIRPWSNQWIFPDWMPDTNKHGRILHEFSHTIGLPDTYRSTADCRKREALEPHHIVTSGTSLKVDDDGTVLNFYAAEHIFALLEPLCGRP